MKRATAIVAAVFMLLLACGHPRADTQKEVRKEFDGIKSVKINTVSGDCIVKTHGSSKVIVDLYYDVEPEDAFSYKFRETGGSLRIQERWHDSGGGDVLWTLTVPAETEIEFSTASGDLTVSGLAENIEASTASGDIEITDVKGEVSVSVASGDIRITNARGDCEASTASGHIRIAKSGEDVELSTASGDIEAVDITGEISLSTASGDVEVSDSKGSFELSCASGSVRAENITIDGPSEFSTASGEVEVKLAETSEYDLELSTASGDVLLDYNGKPVKGYFEFVARKRGGRIKCPFKFEDEEEFEENDTVYTRKSFHQKEKTPEIYLRTSSGRVELKK